MTMLINLGYSFISYLVKNIEGRLVNSDLN